MAERIDPLLVDTVVSGETAGIDSVAVRHAYAGVLFEDTAPPTLDGTDAEALAWLDEPEDPDLARLGGRIGPYVLEALIGRGGMGAVYRASRADGAFHQQVALKLIRPAVGARELAQRFRRERDILARLGHPNIARLLDGGVSRRGELYYAMELVDGVGIDVWCAERQPTVEQRLDLFLQVGAAIGYAHQNLVVHRDLKPSNLLVSADGTVKLLDFGIAKLLAGDAPDDATELTRAEDRVLTPSYAAPEQVLGRPITTATDVYALGLLLSELLSGVRVQAFAGRSLLDAEQAVVRDDPVAPSAAVLARGGADPAPFGVVASPSWARRLRGDLDAIVAKALRKDPAQRYASVALLADDVQRHLDGRPVDAARGALGYRLGKFVRRHRAIVAVGALLLLAVVAGIAAVAWQAERAARQAARAEQVKGYVLGLFRGVDPQFAQGREVTARELLDRGIDNLRRDLADQPDTRAELLQTLGGLYLQINHREEGSRLLAESLALRRTLVPPGDPVLLPLLIDLAWSRTALSRYEEARALLTEADAILAAGGPSLDGPRMRALDLWVTIHVRTGDLPAAEVAAAAGEELARRHFGADDERYAAAMSRHAWVYTWTSRYRESEALLQRALAIGLRHPDPTGVRTRGNYVLLGNLAYYRGDYRRSRDFFVKAQEISLAHLGPDHAVALSDRGFLQRALGSLGDVDAAETGLRAVVAQFAQPLNQDYVERPFHTWSLALLLAARGKLHEAAERQHEVVQQLVRASGDRAKISLYARRDLGAILAAAGRLDEAEPLLAEAHAGLVRFEGESGMQAARAEIWIAECLRQRGELEQAARHIDHARPVLVEVLGTGHDEVAAADLVRGRVALDRGDPAAAVPPLRQAVDHLGALFGADDLRSANARFLLGRAETTLHENGGAALTTAAARTIVAAPGNESPLAAEARRWLAQAR